MEARNAAIVCVVGIEVLIGCAAGIQEFQGTAFIVTADLVSGGGAGGIESAGNGRGVSRCLGDADRDISNVRRSDRWWR